MSGDISNAKDELNDGSTQPGIGIMLTVGLRLGTPEKQVFRTL